MHGTTLHLFVILFPVQYMEKRFARRFAPVFGSLERVWSEESVSAMRNHHEEKEKVVGGKKKKQNGDMLESVGWGGAPSLPRPEVRGGGGAQKGGFLINKYFF